MRRTFILLGCLLSAAPLWAGPANDNFASAIAITSTNTIVTGSNVGATKEPGEPDHAGDPGGKSVWWTFSSPGAGYVSLSTAGSLSSYYPGEPLDTLLAVYTGNSVSTLTCVASNDEDPTVYFTSRLGFKTSPGVVYRIAVDGYTYDTAADADQGSIQLSLIYTGLATNDDFVNAGVLVGTNLTVAGDNDYATKEPGEPDHAGDTGGKSVWWSWQAPATGYVTISTAGSVDSQTGSDLQALLAVYTGDTVSDLTPVASQSSAPASVRFRATGGQVYRIAVDGASQDDQAPSDCSSGSILLSLSFSPGLPAAPAWGPVPDLNYTLINSAQFAGKVVMLNFWATWCPPCQAEVPDLEALYQKYAPDGLVIVAVSVDLSTDGVNPPISLVDSFVGSYGMTFPVLMDRPSWWNIENLYGGIPYIPTTFIIDRQNHVLQQFVGEQSYSTYEQAVLPALYDNLTVNIGFSNGKARLLWPLTQAAFVVESATNLNSGSWTPVTAPVQSDGVNRFADVPIGPGRMFFRLRNQ